MYLLYRKYPLSIKKKVKFNHVSSNEENFPPRRKEKET